MRVGCECGLVEQRLTTPPLRKTDGTYADDTYDTSSLSITLLWRSSPPGVDIKLSPGEMHTHQLARQERSGRMYELIHCLFEARGTVWTSCRPEVDT